MFLSDLDPFFVMNLALGVGVVKEKHQGGARIDPRFELGPVFHFDQPDADVANRVVIGKAVGLLDDHFIFHSQRVGQAACFFLVVAREAGSGAER